MNQLEFKTDKDDHPIEKETLEADRNLDKTGYKSIAELELGETNLRFSMRRKVAAFLTCCTGLILVVFVWHLITPASWRWLSPADLDKIQNIALTVFGGLVMSIGTLFYSKK